LRHACPEMDLTCGLIYLRDCCTHVSTDGLTDGRLARVGAGDITLVRQKDNSKITIDEMLDLAPYHVGAPSPPPRAQNPSDKDDDDEEEEDEDEDEDGTDDEGADVAEEAAVEERPTLRRTRSSGATPADSGGSAAQGRRKRGARAGSGGGAKGNAATRGSKAKGQGAGKSKGKSKKTKLTPPTAPPPSPSPSSSSSSSSSSAAAAAASGSTTPLPSLRPDISVATSGEGGSGMYKLRAAIIHHGSGIGKGHYTVFIHLLHKEHTLSPFVSPVFRPFLVSSRFVPPVFKPRPR
jgi:hypothetical protein